MSFNGRVALVTGGGSGIGKAIAKELAKLGASVVIADISRTSADGVVAEINAVGGNAAAIEMDSALPEDNEAAVDFA